MTEADWLPPLVAFNGDWNRLEEYIEQVYAIFVRDFVRRSAPPIAGARVSLRRYPEFQGKSASFWHLVTEGKTEESRHPVIERCERIAWPRAILENFSQADSVCVWRNTRGTDQRLLIAPRDFSYVVILQERGEEQRRFFLLLTAYPVAAEHRRRKLSVEYAAWVQASKDTKG